MMLLANRDHKLSPAQLSVTQTRQWMADKKAGKEQMTTVIWTTLLGLPIVQPYRRAGRKQVSCSLLGLHSHADPIGADHDAVANCLHI